MRLLQSFLTSLALAGLTMTPVYAQNSRIEPAPLPSDEGLSGGTLATPAPPSPVTTSATSVNAQQPEVNQMSPCIRASETDHFQKNQGIAGQNAAQSDTTYHKDDLIGAGEGVFGKGAKGLAQIIEKSLKDQGEPNGYIVGREAAGAFIVGVRYGSGTLCHKVEGQRPVYWTGPSLGFDWGGDANKVFILVYNLYDTQDIYKRFGQIEGRAYFIGGLSATYLRKENVVLIPIRLGVGLRLGANFGYMKVREKGHWFPF